MRMLRVLLVLTGMLIALPIFAMPNCSHCNTEILQCEPDEAPATGIVCRATDCSEHQFACNPAVAPLLAEELTVASVEVVTPQRHTVTTTNAKTVRVAAANLH